MELKPSWVTKTDPKLHPDRFLASVWQQKMQANFGISVYFGGKEIGQLRDLRLHLGDLTQLLIEWVVDPVNWWLFCQQVRAERQNHRVCAYPDIGLLLKRRGSAVTAMRSKLSNSSAGAEFIQQLDQRQYQQMRALLLAAYAPEKPEWLAKIEAAKTPTDMQKVFNEIMDESQAESATDISVLKDSA